MLTTLWARLVMGPDGRWQPGIGDPTPLGWITSGAYFVAFLLCLAAWFRAAIARKRGQHGELTPQGVTALACAWASIALLLCILGVNKQLDLQTWLTQMGREISTEQGWYHRRRVFQFWGVLAMTGAGLVGTSFAAWMLRPVLRYILGALAGVGMLLVFVVVRAASFHHVDALLFRGSVRLNWVIELGGIFVVAVSAIRFLAHFKQRRRTP